MKKIFKDFIKQYIDAINNDIDIDTLLKSAEMIKEVNNKGGKIILCGNGGSAAMASHVAVDLTKNASIRAINFNESDLITCFANDYGYENWVEQALKFYADENDLVILISSSGNSMNMVNAANYCKKVNMDSITLTGFSKKNKLRNLGKINFWVDSLEYNIVEMTHHIILLLLVDGLINES
ncbi:MAG: SIS domain-containing protein [Flavobacteriaceae bacterium]|nr:SIS domain-containing protein [Flavobacteriaceae bacterium]MBL6685102.1 SIS domain-containing protein [Flavobacteriaceae bacterium]